MTTEILHLSIAGLKLRITKKTNDLFFDKKAPSLAYINNSEFLKADYELIYHHTTTQIILSEYKKVFVGDLLTDEYIKYKWYIYKTKDSIAIKVDYDNHPTIDEIVAINNNADKKVTIFVKGKKDTPLVIDPYLHPFGPLLTMYLLHWNNGLLIHASCIVNSNTAYAFTGVSGIGKSTMAGLWNKSGHTVINDDRLAIRIINNEAHVFNTPMPHYVQAPKSSKLTKIFILKQNPNNYIKQLNGVNAFTKVLGNFIQQLYEPTMIQKHLGIVEEMLKTVKVYEVGFKPDTEIVDLIKKMD